MSRCFPVASTAVTVVPASGARRPRGIAPDLERGDLLADERGPQLRGRPEDRVAFGHAVIVPDRVHARSVLVHKRIVRQHARAPERGIAPTSAQDLQRVASINPAGAGGLSQRG